VAARENVYNSSGLSFTCKVSTLKRLLRCSNSFLSTHYGSYKAWFQIAALADDDVKDATLNVAAGQHLNDQQVLSSTKSDGSSLSLVAEWASREKISNHQLAASLAKRSSPGSKTTDRQYRQLVASLSKALDTTEIKMCSND
jgi:hypothetical protein